MKKQALALGMMAAAMEAVSNEPTYLANDYEPYTLDLRYQRPTRLANSNPLWMPTRSQRIKNKINRKRNN